jgi:hypothetical protein
VGTGQTQDLPESFGAVLLITTSPQTFGTAPNQLRAKTTEPFRITYTTLAPATQEISRRTEQVSAAGMRWWLLSPSYSLSFRPEAPTLSCHFDRRLATLLCHFDRRPKAAVEKSCREPAVPLWASSNSRPDLNHCGPEPGAQGRATSMRGEISRLRYRSARDDKTRDRPAPKKLTGRVPWLRSRSHVFLEARTCLRQRRHGTQSRRLVPSACPPRSAGRLYCRAARGVGMTTGGSSARDSGAGAWLDACLPFPSAARTGDCHGVAPTSR